MVKSSLLLFLAAPSALASRPASDTHEQRLQEVRKLEEIKKEIHEVEMEMRAQELGGFGKAHVHHHHHHGHSGHHHHHHHHGHHHHGHHHHGHHGHHHSGHHHHGHHHGHHHHGHHHGHHLEKRNAFMDFGAMEESLGGGYDVVDDYEYDDEPKEAVLAATAAPLVSTVVVTQTGAPITSTVLETVVLTDTAPVHTEHVFDPLHGEFKCGPEHGNALCPEGRCCSKFGFCGSSVNHCLEGCQLDFGVCGEAHLIHIQQTTVLTHTVTATPTNVIVSHETHHLDGKCGPKHDNKLCPTDSCCSEHGFCGKTEHHCLAGCLNEFGVCGSEFVLGSTTTITGTHTGPFEHLDGKCGPKHDNKLCPTNSCCSEHGFCGKTEHHCLAGCLNEFGVCGSEFVLGSTTTTVTGTHTGPFEHLDGKCGPKHDNKLCPTDSCCSEHGFCGKTEHHCLAGCVEEFGVCGSEFVLGSTTTITGTHTGPFEHLDGKCGPKHDNKLCPTDSCCSEHGFCGKTEHHCLAGCLEEFGVCGSEFVLGSTTTTGTHTGPLEHFDGKCGPQHDNKLCPSGSCCSEHGFCGSTEQHCGAGCQSAFGTCTATSPTIALCGHQHGDRVCPQGQCCSVLGHCGNSHDDCNGNCNSIFGVCGPQHVDGYTTTTTNTLTHTVTPTSTITSACPTPTHTGPLEHFKGECGPNHDNQVCPEGTCCSKYGFCGNTNLHCEAGCDGLFGDCGSEHVTHHVTVPIGTVPGFDGLCGVENGDKKCPEGTCCSKFGFCGNTNLHCEAGCNDLFGVCGSSHVSSHVSVGGNGPDGSLTHHLGKCGPEHDGKVCPEGSCCSSHGFCGNTSLHCEATFGCQDTFGSCGESYIHNDHTSTGTGPVDTSFSTVCGPEHDGKVCPEGTCCSMYGHCGVSNLHCKVELGCLTAFGSCGHSFIQEHHDIGHSITTTSASTVCGPENGGLSCPTGTCCSKFGHCGVTDLHCLVDLGCDSVFGDCGSSFVQANVAEILEQEHAHVHPQVVTPSVSAGALGTTTAVSTEKQLETACPMEYGSDAYWECKHKFYADLDAQATVTGNTGTTTTLGTNGVVGGTTVSGTVGGTVEGTVNYENAEEEAEDIEEEEENLSNSNVEESNDDSVSDDTQDRSSSSLETETGASESMQVSLVVLMAALALVNL